VTRGAPAAARLSGPGSGSGRALQGCAYRCAQALHGVRKHALFPSPSYIGRACPAGCQRCSWGPVYQWSSLGNEPVCLPHSAGAQERACRRARGSQGMGRSTINGSPKHLKVWCVVVVDHLASCRVQGGIPLHRLCITGQQIVAKAPKARCPAVLAYRVCTTIILHGNQR
jgi:hypothetical protein